LRKKNESAKTMRLGQEDLKYNWELVRGFARDEMPLGRRVKFIDRGSGPITGLFLGLVVEGKGVLSWSKRNLPEKSKLRMQLTAG
jgi:hypothetical protein